MKKEVAAARELAPRLKILALERRLRYSRDPSECQSKQALHTYASAGNVNLGTSMVLLSQQSLLLA